MSQTEVKPTIQFFNFVKSFVTEEISSEKESETKLEYWGKMKDELIIAGYSDDLIGRTIKNSIEQRLWETKYEKLDVPRDEFKWHSGHFYSGCKTNQLTQLYNLPKSPVQDTSINTPVESRLKRLIEITIIAIQKARESPLLDSKITAQQYEEWDILLDILEDTFNEKTKVPMNTEHLLLFRGAISESVTFAAVGFFEDRMIQLKKIKKLLTGKQIGYYQDNDIKLQLSLFKPDSRDTAIFQKYYGLQCVKCDSWRVKELSVSLPDGSNLKCKDCEHTFYEKTVNRCRYCQMPLYKEHLHDMIVSHNQMVKNGNEDAGYPCVECQTENKLPQELVEYGLSQ